MFNQPALYSVMKIAKFIFANFCLFLIVSNLSAQENLKKPLDSRQLYSKFSQLALSCIHKEYPNIVKHMMNGPEDVKTPKKLYPAFYGCFDWHSSVHGHWLLVRLLKKNSSTIERKEMISKLSLSFSEENIKGELAYFNRKASGTSFERPYGLAWFLQLTAELREWDNPHAKQWLTILLPLEDKIISNLSAWLPKLAFPIRVGEHSQTAFAFGLMLDWSRSAENNQFETLLTTGWDHAFE